MKKQLSVLLLSALLLTACTPTIPMDQSSDVSGGSQTEQSQTHAGVTYEYTFAPMEYEYNIPSRYYSEGLKNIVKRARQMCELSWTPLRDVEGFNGETVFEANSEVLGLPYGQPVYSGAFIGYDITLEEFVDEVKRADSPFYTDVGRYEEPSPYYSLDCSTFICYAWARPKRMIASLLTQWGDYAGSTTNDIMVGDALIAVGDATHAVLITGVREDENNNVVWVEISELTPPLAKVTRYGDGELFSLDDLEKLYFDRDYKLYRNTDFIKTTPYEHNCASPIDGDYCQSCTNPRYEYKVTMASGGMEIALKSSTEDTAAFSCTVEDEFYGQIKYVVPNDKTALMYDEPNGGGVINTIPGGSIFTVTELVTVDGKTYGKTRSGGKSGYVALDVCVNEGGTLSRGEMHREEASRTGTSVEASIFVPASELYDGCVVRLYAVTQNGTLKTIGRIKIKGLS